MRLATRAAIIILTASACGYGWRHQGRASHQRADELALNVVEDPIHIHDLQATILHCLGLEHTRLTYRYLGRDFRLTDVGGKVVQKLLA
jgi:hypothetical protein